MDWSFLEQRDQIVSLMYEAAVNPCLWPRALVAFADAARSVELTLAVGDSGKARSASLAKVIFTCGRWEPSVPASYLAHYSKINPMSNAIDQTSDGDLLVCQEHISDEQVSHSEYYQDFLIANGGRYQGGWVLENNGKRQISLALHRRKARFEREELRPWESVAQHARQAVSLGAVLAPSLARGELLRPAIDHRGMVCLMVDSNGRVLDCSTAAVSLLESGGVLRLGHQGQVTTVSREETTRLHNLIVAAAAGRTGGGMRLAGHWLVQVVPSGVTQQNPFDPRFAHCALIFVTPPKAPGAADWRGIQLVLGCTRAEAEVAADLVSGMSPSEIAARRNASLNTVRTQIRMLLERTDLHRIAELVGFLATIR